MTNVKRIRYLRIALIIIGLVFVSLYPLMYFWPSGWIWLPRQYEYEQMMVAVYGTLGVFLFIAVRHPLKHLSLIWFTIWSMFVHGLVMATQAFIDETEYGHFFGDVPFILIAAFVLAFLTPRDIEVKKIKILNRNNTTRFIKPCLL